MKNALNFLTAIIQVVVGGLILLDKLPLIAIAWVWFGVGAIGLFALLVAFVIGVVIEERER